MNDIFLTNCYTAIKSLRKNSVRLKTVAFCATEKLANQDWQLQGAVKSCCSRISLSTVKMKFNRTTKLMLSRFTIVSGAVKITLSTVTDS